MSFSSIENLLNVCVKCGNCRFNCPVFSVDFDEGGTARGKISLLKELLKQNSKFSEETLHYLDSCTYCGTCREICPREVDYLSIISLARQKAVKDGQVSRMKKAFLNFLANNKNLKLSSFAKNLFSRKSGLVFKLPKIGRYFPLPDKPLEKRIKNYNPPVGEKKFDVLFFAGCAFRFVFSESGLNTVKVLNRLGIGVYFEENLNCCGFPHLTAGERDMFDELKNKNLEIFEHFKGKVKYIVSACATCGSNLAFNYRLPVPFKDINRLIAEDTDYKPQKKLVLNTYFHHPCHLMKHQKVKKEPEKILGMLTERKPLKGEDFCCGFGGSFSIFQADLSKKIGDKKIELIKQSITTEGENAVVTSCPGCIIQIKDGLIRNNLPYKIVHIIDLINKEMEERE